MKAELEQTLMLLREFIEIYMLTDRSAEHSLMEIGSIESELAKRHGESRLARFRHDNAEDPASGSRS